jgi:hypothetical protein
MKKRQEAISARGIRRMTFRAIFTLKARVRAAKRVWEAS